MLGKRGYIKASRLPVSSRNTSILLHKTSCKQNDYNYHYRHLRPQSHYLYFPPSTNKMKTSMLLPIVAFALSPLVSASCTNSYGSYKCSGTIFGPSNGDVSQFFCCNGSSDCSFYSDGSVTKCTSGTQTPLTSSGAGSGPGTGFGSNSTSGSGGSSTTSSSAPAHTNDARALTASMALFLSAGIFAASL